MEGSLLPCSVCFPSALVFQDAYFQLIFVGPNPARGSSRHFSATRGPISAKPTRFKSFGQFSISIPVRETFPRAAAAQTRTFREESGSLNYKFK